MRTERRLKNTVPFKKFFSWYFKGLGIVGVSIISILSTAIMVLMYTGEANHQHTNKVELMREDKYIEPDFQDMWKVKGE